MTYIAILAAFMIFTVVYLMIGGISLINSDDDEQDQIDIQVRAALLK